MKKKNLKKLLILNIPYVFVGLFTTKLAEGWRLAEGVNASQKFLHLMTGLKAAFETILPSFHPTDLLFGALVGGALRLAVYIKSKNAKISGRTGSTVQPAGALRKISSHLWTRISGRTSS